MIRKLGIFEKLTYYASEYESQNFVFYAKINAQISPAEITNAFQQSISQHQICKSSLANMSFIDCLNDPALFIVHNQSFEEIINKELNAIFNVPDEPLLRLTVNYEKGICTLFITLHHIIADGVSTTAFFMDILESISGKESKKSFHHIKPPLEYYFDLLPENNSEAFHIKNIKSPTSLVEQHVQYFHIDENSLSSLLKTCKSHQITFNMLVTALLAKTLWLACEKNYNTINSMHPINMRRYKPEIENRDFGYFLSRLDFPINFDTTTDIIAIAKNFNQFFNEKAYDYAINIMKNTTNIISLLEKTNLSIMDLIHSSQQPTLWLTNVGVLSKDQEFCYKHKILDCGFVFNSNALLPNGHSILVTLLTNNGTSSLNIHFGKENKINEKMFIFLLNQEIGNLLAF